MKISLTDEKFLLKLSPYVSVVLVIRRQKVLTTVIYYQYYSKKEISTLEMFECEFWEYETNQELLEATGAYIKILHASTR